MQYLYVLFCAILIYFIILWILIVEFKRDRNRIIVSHSNSMKYLLSKIQTNSKQHMKNKKNIQDIQNKYNAIKSKIDRNFNQNNVTHQQLKEEIRLNELQINNFHDTEKVDDEM